MSNDYQRRNIPIPAFGKARPRVTRTGHAYMPDSYTSQRDALRLMFGAVDVAPPWRVRVTVNRAGIPLRIPAVSVGMRQAFGGEYDA